MQWSVFRRDRYFVFEVIHVHQNVLNLMPFLCSTTLCPVTPMALYTDRRHDRNCGGISVEFWRAVRLGASPATNAATAVPVKTAVWFSIRI